MLLPNHAERKENAPLGYETAINIWLAELDRTWNRFNAMLVANGILIAVVGQMLASEHAQELRCATCSVSCCGLLLCWFWYSIVKRGHSYEKLWVWSAREIETNLLAPTIGTLARGHRFTMSNEEPSPDSKGKWTKFKEERFSPETAVSFQFGDKHESHRLKGLPERLRVRYAAYGIILLFALVYSFLAGFSLGFS